MSIDLFEPKTESNRNADGKPQRHNRISFGRIGKCIFVSRGCFSINFDGGPLEPNTKIPFRTIIKSMIELDYPAHRRSLLVIMIISLKWDRLRPSGSRFASHFTSGISNFSYRMPVLIAPSWKLKGFLLLLHSSRPSSSTLLLLCL